jgi:hypothetical protein
VYDQASTVVVPTPAYLAFVKVDADGRTTPAQLSRVPDIGAWRYTGLWASLRWNEGKGPALTESAKTLCVKNDPTTYTLRTKSDVDCAGFHPGGDSAGYYPLRAQLYFHPSGRQCSEAASVWSCGGGRYFLDIAPRAEDSDLRASAGDIPPERTTTTAEDIAENTRGLVEGLAYAAAIVVGVNAILHAGEPERPRDALQEYRERMQREHPELNAPPPAAPRRLSVGSYTPDWVGQKIRAFGTVSRVERVSNHVMVQFAEARNRLIACVGTFGFMSLGLRNDNELVGKVVELHGIVAKTPYYCSGGDATIEPLQMGDFELSTQR